MPYGEGGNMQNIMLTFKNVICPICKKHYTLCQCRGEDVLRRLLVAGDTHAIGYGNEKENTDRLIAAVRRLISLCEVYGSFENGSNLRPN